MNARDIFYVNLCDCASFDILNVEPFKHCYSLNAYKCFDLKAIFLFEGHAKCKVFGECCMLVLLIYGMNLIKVRKKAEIKP